MPFFLSKQILHAYLNYDYFGLVTYGPLRCGKSSHAIQILAEVYGILENPDWKKQMCLGFEDWANWVHDKTTPQWDAWKTWLVFKPREYVNKVREETKIQRCMIVWDDAAFWLSHYGYKNPFLKAVGEYLNVAASDWASILFTAPNPKWLLTHVRGLPGGHTGRVSKLTGDLWAQQLRYMKVYEGWNTPDFKKSGVTAIFMDKFTVRLPNKVFYEYDLVRRSYAAVAKERMLATLDYIEKAYGTEKATATRKEIEEDVGITLSE